ncbi:MAG: PAS domain S-box protein [Nitrospirae bacterium]|nr:PAS domain S-box protein [Nitrospirota bacterium]
MEKISTKLKWLMGARVLMVTALLGTSILLRLGYRDVFYLLITLIYILTILYSLLINRVSNLILFSYLQISLDILLETFLVYLTGGIDSPYTPLYIISIISASIILFRNGSNAAASLSAIMYGGLVDIQYYKMIPSMPTSSYSARETLYFLFIYTIAFFTVAFLSGDLAEKVKQTGKELISKETDLTSLQAFNENILQSISSGLLTTDLQGRITSFNRAAGEITGFSFEEVHGKCVEEALGWKTGYRAPTPYTLHPTPYTLHPSNTPSRRFDIETSRKDGSRLILGFTISPFKDKNGEDKGSIWVFQDLTRTKEMEEEMSRRERLATIGELAAGIAHEIRNPLASISGSMQVLNRDLDMKDEDRHLMEVALKETERLNSIVTEFLIFARPIQLNPKPCNIIELLAETISLAKKSRDYRDDIEILTDFHDENMYITIDQDKIKQVFWNLLINAFQAMPGGGRFRIETRGRSSGEGIEIVFEDNGEGIKKEDIGKIFNPFFTTKCSGSGLGLAVVQKIVKEHNGDIGVKSAVGMGSLFTVNLPSVMGKT